jgi:hypothetical protein
LHRRASGHLSAVDEDLTGVARGAETLLDVLGALADEGFTGEFAAAEVDEIQHGRIVCSACDHAFAADAPEVGDLRRLEGASDPDDMLAVVALTCPNCATRGTLVLNYGPTATVEDSAALEGLVRPGPDAH